MSHTPEQARELWCPMVRLAASDGSSVPMGQTVMNRLQDGRKTTVPDSSRCIADKCAMWRWATADMPPPGAEPGKLVVGVPARLGVGYCGIAGRPEVLA